MKSKEVLVFTIFVVSVFLVGCASPNQPPPNFEGTSWKLDTYLSNIEHVVSPITNTKVSLEFKDGRISGSSGCNTFFAKYTVEGKSMTFGLIGATKMNCTNPGVMEQEQTYLKRLESVKSYKLEGNKLSLIDNNGKTVLVFSKT
ncbi:MAG: META domain protein [Candidatus Methanofastidiosum methylothiophilum]|uniref:META domain protein n=1 Tax=Candidatus Methanofastidiosum methylothiophilum TaxID=1705564 RepID=A0A150IWR9_9EURY|nr:MAG: META domain protein [Candidatus Methanofastidiosum methylthiophilus]KYC47054.1 MAG: META domain protein [Candidatus Methanofastidiosum methylthiophilus]KYC49441.1 MAG: META domain protein [Candidatus Methanofastidiosum methylthiophilus]